MNSILIWISYGFTYRYFQFLLLTALFFNSCGSPASHNDHHKQNNNQGSLLDSAFTESNKGEYQTPIQAPAINGLWVVSMKCIETDCEGSAIGDIKTERWSISINDRNIKAEVRANETLSRIYEGKQQGEFYDLSLKTVKNGITTQAKMLVKLKPLSQDHMEGTREIFRDECHIVYSLELHKQ